MIAKLVKGKGFRGALEYDLREQKGHILDTNMGGDNPRELAREFGTVRALRPNLTKAVCHVSISLPPDEKLTDDQWKDVAGKYLEGMGFKESQYVVTKHTDTEHPHIHILANRVSMAGEVVSDSRDYQRQEAIMRRLYLDLAITATIFVGVAAYVAFNVQTNRAGGIIVGLMLAGAYWGWQFISSLPLPVFLTTGAGLIFYMLLKFFLSVLAGFIIAPWQIFKRIREIRAISKLKQEINNGQA
ncbi:hypothetical protein CE91St38_19110 [Desulfovibrionaceae bacterium]|nr:hypothetical protein CE91St38_19110 [Desulfovibrionaceae bacterium]GKI12453.1 hypothetical protein CE91St39_19070 [Desulfovibrionaceae bacterium]